jgi:hypothetical protein
MWRGVSIHTCVCCQTRSRASWCMHAAPFQPLHSQAIVYSVDRKGRRIYITPKYPHTQTTAWQQQQQQQQQARPLIPTSPPRAPFSGRGTWCRSTRVKWVRGWEMEWSWIGLEVVLGCVWIGVAGRVTCLHTSALSVDRVESLANPYTYIHIYIYT